MPLLERLGEHERLERRARLALALGGEVERRAVVVVAADHRADLAGLVVDRHQRGARAAGVGQPGADRVVGGLLEAPVDRGLDRQAALERLARAGLAAAELVDHLLLDPGGEVRVLGLLPRRLDLAPQRDRLRDRGVVLLARDQLLLEHAREHLVAALLGGDGMGDRVERARRGDHAGDQRGLLRLELGGAGPRAVGVAARVLAAEVGAGGGLDAVGAVAEVDRVEVVAQDLLLRPLARDVVRQRGLAQLHEQRPLVLGGERVLDELLGDRRSALDRPLGDDVLVQRAADAAEVDAVVGVEALVLDRDDRVLHHRRDLALLQQDPLLVAGQAAERLAAAVDDDRVGRRRLLELRQVGGDGHHHPEHRRDDREQAQTRQQREDAQLADAQRDARWLVAVGVLRVQRDDPRLAVFGDGGRVGGALRIHTRGRQGREFPLTHSPAAGRPL